MITRSFYFLRHGETDWNSQRLMQGWTDIPLNDNGIAQAEKAAALIAEHPIDLVVSSPLSRAHRTAEIVNDALKKPLLLDEQLKERSWGIFEGKHVSAFDQWRASVKHDWALEETGYPVPPEGEPYPTFKNRCIETFAHYLDTHRDQNILFVAHGGVYRTLLRFIERAIEQSPNAQPYHFEKSDKGWAIHVL